MESSVSSFGESSLWDTLGRETAAGRALFNIYNGDHSGRQVGNEFSAMNRAAVLKRIAKGLSSKAGLAEVSAGKLFQKPGKPPAKPAIKVPKVGLKKGTADAGIDRFQSAGGRRKAEVIQKQLEANVEMTEFPLPRGPLLDDREKERLALLMQFRGEPPEVTNADRTAMKEGTSVLRPRRGPREELEELFDKVRSEIEERRKYLDDLRSLGVSKKDFESKQAIIKREIVERVTELEKIDFMLQEL